MIDSDLMKREEANVHMETMEKLAQLKQRLAGVERLGVCYSGGVDSALLLKVAHDVLGDRAFGIMADAVVVPRAELRDAQALAREIGAACHVVQVDALSVPELRRNDKRRCYHCKMNIFSHIQAKARTLGATVLADGKNADDAKVYRPGAQAAEELGVISPLYDAGMTKAEIRVCSRQLGLPTWDKPSAACLASRLPYDTEVTPALLSRVERAEEALHAHGYLNVRARIHGDIVRIEAPVDALPALVLEQALFARIKALGFQYVTLDAEGFRSGSMDV